MIQTETGTVFIGFTGQLKCEKCGNLTFMHLRQEYMKEKTFFVDQGTSFMHVHRVCPICENKTFVGRPKAMLRKSEVTELHRLLDSGLPDTKTWLRSLPEKQMDQVLERYYSLEAFEFMRRILQ